jgi:hypothetical protein
MTRPHGQADRFCLDRCAKNDAEADAALGAKLAVPEEACLQRGLQTLGLIVCECGMPLAAEVKVLTGAVVLLGEQQVGVLSGSTGFVDGHPRAGERLVFRRCGEGEVVDPDASAVVGFGACLAEPVAGVFGGQAEGSHLVPGGA